MNLRKVSSIFVAKQHTNAFQGVHELSLHKLQRFFPRCRVHRAWDYSDGLWGVCGLVGQPSNECLANPQNQDTESGPVSNLTGALLTPCFL